MYSDLKWQSCHPLANSLKVAFQIKWVKDLPQQCLFNKQKNFYLQPLYALPYMLIAGHKQKLANVY